MSSLTNNSNREELIDELVRVKDIVKYQFVDAVSIEYCDDRCSPVLEVSLVNPVDSDGNTVWSLHFIDSGNVFEYKERADLNGSREKQW